MKTLVLLMLSAIGFAGCFSGKQVQADMVSAQLVRIDTIYRYPDKREKLLTWRSAYNVEYTSYVPMSSIFFIGTRMPMLVTK
ncbi:MAG: hypothetical protein JWN76_1301 [Chitinophagaceae bacterium]|nr:hypothetical protein [Chitinophagaceae bacterium]